MLVILGPTASGKTQLAVQLAQQLIHGGQAAEIISADSRQVYRGMDIGTGKDLAEYTIDGQFIPYHLIDIVEAGDDYNVFRYQQDFDRVMEEVRSRHAVPILCGGSGMYIEAALRPDAMLAIPPNEPLRTELEALNDEQLHARFEQTPSGHSARADTSTRKRLIRAIEIGTYLNENPGLLPTQRPPLPAYRVIGLDPPVNVRRERISQRLRNRLQYGLVEEVEHLLNQGIPAEKLIYYGLEYKYVTQYVLGQLTYLEMVAQLETAIHQFAKRQMTYFRKMERDGLAIDWQ
ncbi:tRNA (adenosine(37)-N6)-dimethylallyltransferase MiaA [Fibrella forsythiae]|uniref:tRNA dimethylallyltransferase n=1 Tax=Fibrella forsythiae TaxID=2817061 RepID=A0ABS3JKS3_9BACT|nr:tRNA (adenosine(37)-N6)-dimethylallyltransferase MiaA [Fibrella forsythiae]MBO0949502.1 tRNA (adenosine(37)-N6)-dimethylallyltransferase MiaA [Fibrella forsythiae]